MSPNKNRRGMARPKTSRVQRNPSTELIGSCYNLLANRPSLRSSFVQPRIDAVLVWEVPNLLSTSTSIQTLFGQSFSLSGSFSNATEYLGLFDQYKINLLEVWLEPTGAGSAQGSTAFATVTSAIDLDDATTPTSAAQVISKPGAVISNGAAGHYHRFEPHIALAAYSGAFTSFVNSPPRWIDSASPGVQHYGLKVVFDSTPVAVQYRLTTKAHCSFRNPGI